MDHPTKIACIGAGYFARYHVDAWMRLPDAQLVAICDQDEAKARALADEFGVERVFTDPETMCREVDFSVADIITPPETHLALVTLMTQHGKHIICQKPLAPTLAESEEIHRTCVRAQKRFMVHENFRFQPWHRKMKELISEGILGDRLHTITQTMRTGDGYGPDAYLGRQPYFRTMPRLLMFETGIHFIDVLRCLGGEVTTVFAKMRTLNPVIVGEDAAIVLLDFASGAQGIIDGNRFNEANHPDPRYTFGTTVIEGSDGTLRLSLDGTLTLQRLGEKEKEVEYHHERKGFAGDCVFAIQQHFLLALRSGSPFETNGEDYLKSLTVLEACYDSANSNQLVKL